MFGFRLTRPKELPKPQVPLGYCLYVVGDIHGRNDLLGNLHQKIRADMAARQDDDHSIVVYLGDYVDRGPASREVIERLIDFDIPGASPVFLKGNHEDAMLGFLDDVDILREWVQYGGQATLFSYGVSVDGRMAATPSMLEEIQHQFRTLLPSHHRAFLQNLRLSHAFGDYMFVHAGINPSWPLEEQHPADLLWIRDEFLRSSKYLGKVVVHGHTISKEPEFKPNRIGIDTGAYATGVLTALVLQKDQQRVLQT